MQKSKKGYISNPAIYSCEIVKYLESIIDESGIKYDETINTKISISTKIVITKSTSPNFYISRNFLLITIALLMTVSIYCCFIKYLAKQKHLLLYHSQIAN